jgi:large subunit ribosomal protein L15
VVKLDVFDSGTEITPELLAKKGMLHKNSNPVAILGNGELSKPLTIQAHRFSQSAKAKIEAAGGKALLIEG